MIDFGEEVIVQLENIELGDYFINDLYMVDPKTIYIEVYCRDREVYIDKTIHIDMRKINKPSDLNKYVNQISNELMGEFMQYEKIY